AVGAEHGDDLAFRHREADTTQRLHWPVIRLDIEQLEDGRGHGLSPSSEVFPAPLREGGRSLGQQLCPDEGPPPLTPPRQGEGNAAEQVEWNAVITPLPRDRPRSPRDAVAPAPACPRRSRAPRSAPVRGRRRATPGSCRARPSAP